VRKAIRDPGMVFEEGLEPVGSAAERSAGASAVAERAMDGLPSAGGPAGGPDPGTVSGSLRALAQFGGGEWAHGPRSVLPDSQAAGWLVGGSGLAVVALVWFWAALLRWRV